MKKLLLLVLIAACHDSTAPQPLTCVVVATSTDGLGRAYMSPIHGLPCRMPNGVIVK